MTGFASNSEAAFAWLLTGCAIFFSSLLSLDASIKALDGYCAIHRLLLMFTEEYAQLREYSNQLVSRFCSDEQYRTKTTLPSLGWY
jgi:hypothetical protein